MTRDITTDRLNERLGDLAVTIVDLRPIAAYNGWRLGREARGGHIPGAVSFPAAWLESIEPKEVDRLLLEKQVTLDRTLVLYGYTPEDTAGLEDRLEAAGHDDVRVYGSGFATWAADSSLPLDRLPKFDRLGHPSWARGPPPGGPPAA